MPEGSVQVRYNSAGWRDIEHTVENPDHRPRILILGDSFMEAYSVSLDEAFPRQVATLSQAQGVSIEVINLGVGGYGTLQEYLIFNQIGRAYAPDIVLLAFYVANDVTNNSQTLERLVSHRSMKIDSRPFLDPHISPAWRLTHVDFEGTQRRYVAAKVRQGSVLQQITNQSILMQLGNEAAVKIPLFVSTTLSGSSNTRFLGEHGVNFCIEPTNYTEAWETTERILSRLQQETKAIGSTLVVFSVPALHEVDGQYRRKTEAKAPTPHTLCIEKATGYQRLQGILEKHEIRYVDLLPSFRSLTERGTPLFWESDRHWNAEGHRVAAKHVFSHLLTHKLVNPKQAEAEREDDVRKIQTHLPL